MSTLNRVSERERAILLLGATGLTYNAIAARLGVSHHTIRLQASNLYHKLNAGSLAHALTLLLLAGEITIEQLRAAAQVEPSQKARSAVYLTQADN